MAKVILEKTMNFKGYTLIEGFPGIGLIGTIAASYLAEKLKMEQIGCIYSEKFPPMASIYSGKPNCPVRIYADKGKKVLVIFSDFVIPSDLVYEIAENIIEFSKKNKIKEIISLAGMTSVGFQERRLFAIVSDDSIKNKLEKLGVNYITQGITTGVSGILLLKCKLEGIKGFSLLAESTMGYLDPGAAAFLLKKLGDYLKITIKTDMLEKEAKEIQERVQKTMEQVKAGRMKYKQAEEHLPMYG